MSGQRKTSNALTPVYFGCSDRFSSVFPEIGDRESLILFGFRLIKTVKETCFNIMGFRTDIKQIHIIT